MNDVPKILEWIRINWRGSEAELERKLHRYYLLCCRAIWKLLPHEDSRKGVEVAERYVDGLANDEELNNVNWDVEAVAFNLDYNVHPNEVEKLVESFLAIPADKLSAMIHPVEAIAGLSPREILKQAAYFADFAMVYPHLTPKEPSASYTPFLSAHLLREVFDESALPSQGAFSA